MKRGHRITNQAPAAKGNGAPSADLADPWELVWGQPYINSQRLAAALEKDLQGKPTPDFRTRLLVRDAARALRGFWGAATFRRWLGTSPAGRRISAILGENLGRPGFRNIRSRLVPGIGQRELEQIFTLLGERVHDRVEVSIAGSIPTLIEGLTARPTDDIDIVNEVPAGIREQREVVEQIKAKYGLMLGHVQSHYLPAKWQQRRRFLGDFGGIRVYLVDVYDVFISKLSSKQEKHRDDLRVMAPKLDKEKVKKLLLTDGKSFLDSPFDRPTIDANWRFIYQEPPFAPTEGLPPAAAGNAEGEGKRSRRKKKR
jgi:hypothetical protein